LKSVSVNFAYFYIYLTKLKIPDDCLANWALKSPVWWNWYMVGFLFVCWKHSWLGCSLDGPMQNMFFFVSVQKSKMIIFCITVHICRTICWNEIKSQKLEIWIEFMNNHWFNIWPYGKIF
jgi:succinate dehydrogenase hydrophobic anchor subunit